MGSVLSTHLTGPFGEALTTYPTAPNNASVNGATFQYVGAHEKLTEGDLVIRPIHMGARTYLPQIGRFAQTDPVQGGTPNSYVYPTDPVNDFDLTGNACFSWKCLKDGATKVGTIIGQNSDAIGLGLAAASMAACIIATAGICAGVAVATAIAGGVVSGLGSYSQDKNAWKAVGVGVFSAGIGLIGLKGAKIYGKQIGGIPKAVRWYGKSRNYRSVTTALRRAPGRARATKIVRRYSVSVGIHASNYAYNRWQNK